MDNQILEILKAMQKTMDTIQEDISTMKEDISMLKSQTSENTQILKALVHSSEVNKAEHDKMSNEIAHMTGELKSIKEELLNVEMITASNWKDITNLKLIK